MTKRRKKKKIRHTTPKKSVEFPKAGKGGVTTPKVGDSKTRRGGEHSKQIKTLPKNPSSKARPMFSGREKEIQGCDRREENTN